MAWVKVAVATAAAAVGLTGCSGMSGSPEAAATAAGRVSLRGSLHGGQQAVVGAQIQLYAAGTSGYGAAATPLLTQAVVTDAAGGFSITGDYTCPSATTPVYLLATGGNPGLPSGQTNPDLALLSGLGVCGNLSASMFVAVNEVTTVATAYALAGFMTDATHLASSGSAAGQYGLQVAMSGAQQMADTGTGLALATTPAGAGTVPQAAINTIADILAACVNSAGSGANGGTNPCATMEAAATNASGTAAANTVEVALNMAHRPGQAVQTLYGLQPAGGPFQPTLASAPSDWTMAVVYPTKLPESTNVAGLAIDNSSYVWTVGTTKNSLRVIGGGAEVSGPSGYAVPGVVHPTSVAIDLSGRGWVGGGNGTLAQVNLNGTTLSGAGYASGYGAVNGLAIGIDNSVWTTAQSNVAHLSNAGVAVSPTPAQQYSTAFGAATDASGNLWFTNYGYTNVSKLAPGATYATNYDVGYQAPRAVAIGQANHVWVADSNTNPGAVTELDGTGAIVGGAPYSGGALYGPWAVAVDGDNHAWFSLINCRCVVAMGTGGTFVTPSTGVGSAAVKYATGIGVDGAGNVWVQNLTGTVVELVGAGAPTVTPLVTAAQQGKIGQRP